MAQNHAEWIALFVLLMSSRAACFCSLNLAKEISYEELEPLFGTAVKKSGTRIATMIVLKELLKRGLSRNDSIDEFIAKALEDKNQLLVSEASEI